MPHIIVEYSENLSNKVNFKNVVQELHANLAQEESVDLMRLKTRAIGYSDYSVADKGAAGSFVHITIKLLPRPDDVAKRMAQNLQAIVRSHAGADCAVTAEVVELKPQTYCA